MKMINSGTTKFFEFGANGSLYYLRDWIENRGSIIPEPGSKLIYWSNKPWFTAPYDHDIRYYSFWSWAGPRWYPKDQKGSEVARIHKDRVEILWK